MIARAKSLASLALLGLAALGFSQTNVALGKMATSNVGYYDSGSEVFPTSNLTDGRLDDSGNPSDWSFWLTPNGANGGSAATIDLAGLYSVSSFELQDTHNRGYFDRGTDEYTLSVSLDGTTFVPVVSDAFSDSEWRNLTLKTDTLAVPALARYVRFDVVSGYGGSSVGLNELRVMGAQAVPEPGTIAALGLGGLAMLRRRRK